MNSYLTCSISLKLLLCVITYEIASAFVTHIPKNHVNFIRYTKVLKSVKDGDACTSFSEFKEWCTKKGIITPLDLQQRDKDYRYMEYSDNESFANRPDKLNGPILRVPLKACIVGNTLEELSVNLAKERDMGQESEFSEYINVLPKLGGEESSSLQQMPRFWSEEKKEKISEFDGGQLYHKVELDEQNHKSSKLDPWAYACVTSRANYLMDKGYSMTPILDMINHDSNSKTTASIIEDDLFLSVSKDFVKGDEVFISYGDLTNLDTLCSYGFVSQSNSCNAEYVIVRIIRQNPVNLKIDSDGNLDAGSLAVLRSYLTPPEEVDKLLENNEYLTINTLFAKKVSEAYEEEMYSLIASFVDEGIFDAKNGIKWSQKNGDDLVNKYLTARVGILEKGLNEMKLRFPDLLY